MAVNRQRENDGQMPQSELDSSDLEAWEEEEEEEGEGDGEKEEGEGEGDIRLMQHSTSREDHTLTHSMIDTEISDNDEPS